MTPELTALALAGLLQVVQFGLMSIAANLDVGPAKTMSPRDPSCLGGSLQDQLSDQSGRLFRAFNNHFEALIMFTLAVVVVELSGQNTALTAACAVLRDGPVEGETILVHGAGGTVARLAVQIAADSGASVIATTGRPDHAGDVMAAGAQTVVDYRSDNLVEAVADAAAGRPVTRIIDS